MQTPGKRRSYLLLSVLRALVYAGLPAVFFLFLSAVNPQILRVNRTSGIMLSTFLLLEYLFTRIYGGYRPGEVRMRPNVSALSISALFTDVITYLQLQIMNVNEANHDTLQLFGPDALLLLAAMAVQVALITLLVVLGNHIYIATNPPLRTLAVCGNDEDREILEGKMRLYRRMFRLEDSILYTSEDVRGHVKRAEAVILYHLPPAAHQELIAYAYKHKKVLYFDLNIGNIVSAHAQDFMIDDVLMHAHTQNGLTPSQRFVKRAMDIAVSLVGIVLTSPVLLGCAIAVKAGDGGSVFYRQKRVTRDERIFSVLKFRTMKEHADTEAQHSAEEDDERITPVGRVLRRWRMDELPQLFNILKGEMSLVGPRPEMLENVEMYTHDLPEFAYRDRVKAGLTGYAQISGKYNTSPRDKLMMDITYIETYSLWLDIKLLLKTVLVILRPDATEGFRAREEERGK